MGGQRGRRGGDEELADREARRIRTLQAAERLRACGTDDARRAEQDRIALDHLDVAEAVSRRFSAASADRDDLRQVAFVGLLKAARRFDTAKGEDFVSFAVPTISGEIKRHLRDHGWMVRPPRRIQELRGEIAAARERLMHELGRSPADRELATATGVDLATVRDVRAAQDALSPLSLDAPVAGADDVPLGETVAADDELIERAERAAVLGPALRSLPDREQRILHLRFHLDCTQQEIAHELGVTQMQVSRLLQRSLTALRRQLEPTAPDVLAAVPVADARARRRTA